MKNLKFLSIAILAFGMLIPAISRGQTQKDSSAIFLKNNLDRIYGVDQRLVSGDYYHEPIFNTERIVGHPFLIDGEWHDGFVVIEGVKFNHLKLRYDLAEQKLILQYSDISSAKYQISLNPEKIDSFMINKRLFCSVPATNTKYYEVYSKGKINYLIFRTKVKILNNLSTKKQFNFSENIKQYLRVDDELIAFRKNTLYKLFPDSKRKIKQFKRKEKLSVGKNNFIGRKEIVDYCNSSFYTLKVSQ